MENKLLVLNVVANTSAPIIELLRDTATTAIDYRHLLQLIIVIWTIQPLSMRLCANSYGI